MSPALMEMLFVIWLWVIGALWAVLIGTFILSFFVPKSLLDAYFTQPYFKPAEIQIFSGFPLGYIRTFMFMRIVANPSSGVKRGLDQAHKLAPRWFQVVAKVVLPLFYGLLVVFGVLLLIFAWGVSSHR